MYDNYDEDTVEIIIGRMSQKIEILEVQIEQLTRIIELQATAHSGICELLYEAQLPDDGNPNIDPSKIPKIVNLPKKPVKPPSHL